MPSREDSAEKWKYVDPFTDPPGMPPPIADQSASKSPDRASPAERSKSKVAGYRVSADADAVEGFKEATQEMKLGHGQDVDELLVAIEQRALDHFEKLEALIRDVSNKLDVPSNGLKLLKDFLERELWGLNTRIDDLVTEFGRVGKMVEVLALNAPTSAENSNSHSNGSTMTDITREEFHAKLEATEARMDARLERFDTAMRQAINDFHLEVQPLKGIKANIWGGVAVIAGLFVSCFALSFAAFDTGRETTKAGQEALQQTIQTRQLLEQIKAQQEAIEKARTTAPPTRPSSRAR